MKEEKVNVINRNERKFSERKEDSRKFSNKKFGERKNGEKRFDPARSKDGKFEGRRNDERHFEQKESRRFKESSNNRNFEKREPRKVNTVKATIKKLGINGEGVAYLDKKITFVPGALPDEEVQIEILQNEPNYKTARVVAIDKPSCHRVKAKCHYQKDCQGCPLMILDYPSQLEAKKQVVRDTFKRYLEDSFDESVLEAPIASSYLASYRNIVRLPVVTFNEKVTFGIYQRETKYLTLMTNCLMQSKRINQCLSKIEEIFAEYKVSSYSEEEHKGVRFLTVKEFDEGLQLVFVTGLDRMPEEALKAISDIEDVISVYLTVNTTRKQDFEMQKYELVSGKAQIKQIFMQKPFSISAKADFPVYRQYALRVAKTIASLIEEDVLKIGDLGCGIGLNSLGLDDRYEIIGMDVSKININDANVSMNLQNRENCEFIEGKLDALFTKQSKKHHFDLIMIHHERVKLDEKFADSILASKAKYLIIDSEHVSMLAKDIANLKSAYELTKLLVVDSNPNGNGCCAIACLKRKK